jgi:SnoaL-like domain
MTEHEYPAAQGTTIPAEDLAAIHDLYARYAVYFDEGRVDEYTALFTLDGEFQRPGQPILRGHDEIADMARQRMDRSPGIRHLVTNILIDPAPDGAVGTAYTLVLRAGEDGLLRVLNAGMYRDELVRREGRWQFRRRDYEMWIHESQLDQPLPQAPRA